ncbi:hypothetical protein [Chitinophaga pinensis]|uniref:Uncharacterized protein n=1 Tax=Chitinophaga pinensis (strain ATCC 43595 / DSM 2588 / LMG 13176 / NBRC 15968 / NCIMB 11800 / UQM 2034) TaxID=485918 RepID=A0A979G1H6_CHIPD|nr:hypothetical protein [Chitinophaga pinensis]ACU59099.1 hypothetical protein Cpin_1603 [Chitinophaga pinensis DSM 2588]
MSFDKLQLDPYILARIYNQPIIPGKKEPVAVVAEAAPKVKFLGENQKNIGLFIQNAGDAYLNDDLFNLLTNILNACKLGVQDIALINTAQYGNLPFSTWQTAVPMKQAVLFGIPPAAMGLEAVSTYQLVQVNGCQLICSDDLQIISQDKMLKGKLWMGLKQLLGI